MAAPQPHSAALTVVVAPNEHTDEIIGALGDYSAAGLLDRFVWISARDVGGATAQGTLVRDGISEPVVLQQLLTGERYDRVRVAVLVPTELPADQRVPLGAEQAVEQLVRTSAVGAPITLLRFLLTGGGAAPRQPSATVVLEGWHNLLVAPEDSAGPGLGSVPWDSLEEPLDLAQRVAPTVASVTGLWSGVDQTPFDNLEIPPGQTVRAVRGFYRSLETADIEARLRTVLFDPSGRLPLPRGGQTPVLYVEDTPAAAQTMARALWTKHRDVLRGPRLGVGETAAEAISVGAAVKMFLIFLLAGLRRAPKMWLGALKGSVASVLATTVQGTVFGGRESAFAVVTDSKAADWQSLGRSAETLSTTMGSTATEGQLTQQDLSPLWNDFVNGALTLADGGRRAGGLEPIQVGAGVGVVADAADVVPSSAERFAGMPTSLAAVIGVSTVEPVDLLAAADLRERLQNAYSDANAGVEARGAATELDRWLQRASTSYAWQVGSILTDFLGRARTEAAQLAEQLHHASGAIGADERLRARQKTLSVVLAAMTWATLAVVAILAGIAAAGIITWRYALTTGGAMLGLYLAVSLVVFLITQRDLFALMNLRRSQAGRLAALQANLRNALQDVSRLSTAYGQLLSWSRVLGSVLRAPFGPAPAGRSVPPQITDGLPRCAQVGVADPGAQRAGDAAVGIQRSLYALGWLTQPWQTMVQSAADRLREEPAMLYRMPGVGTNSGLEQWSSAVASGRVQPSGSETLWARVEEMFADPQGVGAAFTETILVPALDRTVPADQFGAGFTDHQAGRAAPFDASTFTNSAIIAGRSAVAIDSAAVTRIGLGYRAVVVQSSDGVAPYDFTLFEVPAEFVGGLYDEHPAVITDPLPPSAPPGEELVF